MSMVIPVIRLPHGVGLPLPGAMTPGSAGADLYAAVDADVILQPGRRVLVPSGIKMAIPSGYEGQMRPRSGLALKHGVTVLNSPGTIDSDYRGEVCILLINLGDEPFTIRRGDRVAQLVLAPVTQAVFSETGQLPVSVRDEGGFGHTGTR